jgi:glutathione S-transferase
MAVHAVRKARQESHAEQIKRAEQGLQTHLNSLEQLFTGRQFIFDRMTVADSAIFTQLHYLYHRVNYQVPNQYKHLLAWMDLMRRTVKLKSLIDLLP